MEKRLQTRNNLALSRGGIMKHRISFAIATALLATAIPAVTALAQDPKPAYPPDTTTRTQSQDQATSNQSEAKMFSGKITKSGGKYTLENSSGKIKYMLDDQKTAKQYEGKVVMVTGTLDEATNMIHVQKIEAAA
jgi:hypothetical protein